jgi:hypothetical protein
MRKRFSLISAALLVALIGPAVSGLTQWSRDPLVNLAIYSGPGRQGPCGLVSDGSDGAIVAWVELLHGDKGVYAQRVDSSGFLLWGADGIPVVEEPAEQISQDIVEDGRGGAIIIWQDTDTEPGDIYAQRVDPLGVIQWPAGGVCLCTDTAGQSGSKIATDCAGGAIVTWFDRRGGSSAQDIYAQRINALGEIQWTGDGAPVCTHGFMQVFPEIVSDGLGGAIVMWEDYRNGSAQAYAQRIDASGNLLWAPEGIRVSTKPESQYSPRIAADGLGGAVICWADGSGEVHAQRIDSSGVAQ